MIFRNWLIILALVFGLDSFAATKNLDEKTLPVESPSGQLELLKKMPEFLKWKLMANLPLSKGINTEHPQGLVIQKDKAIVSISGKSRGALLTYNLIRKDGRFIEAKYSSTFEFAKNSAQAHAGGMHSIGDNEVVVPLSGTRDSNATTVYKVNLATSTAAPLLSVPFHIGTLMSQAKKIFALDYNSDHLYRVNFDAKDKTRDFLASKTALTSKHLAYQDCKALLTEGNFLCTGKRGWFFNVKTFLELVTVGKASTVQIALPHIRPDGTTTSYGGVYVPGWFGSVPLGYNAFDFEVDQAAKILRAYFVPNDNPETHLYIYEADLK